MGHLALLALGAMFLTNALPHLAHGLSGRRFPTAFARPPGRGLSSALVNVLWGAVNLILAWALLLHWGRIDLLLGADALAALAGHLLAGVGLALYFGATNGGERP